MFLTLSELFLFTPLSRILEIFNDSEDLTFVVDLKHNTSVILPLPYKVVQDNCENMAKDIFSVYGFVQIQLLNEGFIETTKSFICNIKNFTGVIDNTLFIATDQISYNNLIHFNNVNVCLKEYKTKKSLKYGENDYYRFMLWRSKLILSLLKNRINFFLTESDAVWLKNLYLTIFHLLQKLPLTEVILVNDRPYGNQFNGGYQFIKHSEKTEASWNDIVNDLKELEKKGVANRNEQKMLTAAYIKYVKDFCVVLGSQIATSGLWFAYEELRSKTNALVLNNFVVGIKAKKQRFINWGFWFLDKEAKTCTVPEL